VGWGAGDGGGGERFVTGEVQADVVRAEPLEVEIEGCSADLGVFEMDESAGRVGSDGELAFVAAGEEQQREEGEGAERAGDRGWVGWRHGVWAVRGERARAGVWWSNSSPRKSEPR
jgi:hypothetical protein